MILQIRLQEPHSPNFKLDLLSVSFADCHLEAMAYTHIHFYISEHYTWHAAKESLFLTVMITFLFFLLSG